MIEEEIKLISCLLNTSAFNEVIAPLKPEYFTDELCSELFKEIKQGNNNIISIGEKLSVDKKLLMDIARKEIAPVRAIMAAYVYKIQKDYQQREIEKIKSENISPEEMLERLQEITQITLKQETKRDTHAEFLKDVEIDMQGGVNPNTVLTGFDSIDKMTKGFRKSELIIIGGRPASGKSALGLNIAVNMAKQGKKVLFVSLEMTELEIRERIVKSETEISNFYNIPYPLYEKIANTSKKIDGLINIIDNGNITLEALTSKVKTLKEKNKIDVIIIDHMGILSTAARYGSRYEQITDISRKLKILAKDNEIPVVVLCQLNRGLENREIKAPTMADLRDSGSIEQDANIIMFVYRPEYHLMQQEPSEDDDDHIEWEENLNKVKGKAYIIISKNRRGLNGKCELAFRGNIYKFTDIGTMGGKGSN